MKKFLLWATVVVNIQKEETAGWNSIKLCPGMLSKTQK